MGHRQTALAALTAVLMMTVCTAASPAGADVFVVDDFEGDVMSRWSVDEEPAGTVKVEKAADAVSGTGALAVTFEASKTGRGLVVAKPRLPEEPSEYKALSLMVRGDGTGAYGIVQIVLDGKDDYFAVFPLADRRWRRVVIPFSDFALYNRRTKSRTFDLASATAICFGARYKRFAWSMEVDDLGFTTEAPPAETPRAQSWWLDLVGTRAGLAGRRPLTIVVIGDSNTILGGAQGDEVYGKAFPALLEARLRKEYGYDDIEVVNAGTPGDTSEQSITRLGAEVLAQSPDLVIVALGGNDIGSLFPPERYARGMALVTRLIRRYSKAEVAWALPTGWLPEEINRTMDAHIAAAKAKAVELGVAVADGWELAKTEGLKTLVRDDVHLGAAGHEKYAAMLFDAFFKKEGVASTSKIVDPGITYPGINTAEITVMDFSTWKKRGGTKRNQPKADNNIPGGDYEVIPWDGDSEYSHMLIDEWMVPAWGRVYKHSRPGARDIYSFFAAVRMTKTGPWLEFWGDRARPGVDKRDWGLWAEEGTLKLTFWVRVDSGTLKEGSGLRFRDSRKKGFIRMRHDPWPKGPTAGWVRVDYDFTRPELWVIEKHVAGLVDGTEEPLDKFNWPVHGVTFNGLKVSAPEFENYYLFFMDDVTLTVNKDNYKGKIPAKSKDN